MNRRSLLGLLAGAAAASTVSYFLPPIGGWKSDIIANPDHEPWGYRYAWDQRVITIDSPAMRKLLGYKPDPRHMHPFTTVYKYDPSIDA